MGSDLCFPSAGVLTVMVGVFLPLFSPHARSSLTLFSFFSVALPGRGLEKDPLCFALFLDLSPS